MNNESFECLRADLSTTFINLPADQIEPNVVGSLARIAEFLAIEQATLYELSQTTTELTGTTWGSDGTNPAPRVAKADDPSCWTMLLERSGVLSSSDPAATHEVWAASVPLKAGGEAIGAIKIASTMRQLPWTDDLAAQLTALAEIFANAVSRKRAAYALLVSSTELHTARAELREREERFTLVADSAPVMIRMSDTNRLCTYFNKPWLDFVGRPMSAEIGNGWANGIHAEDLSGCLEACLRAFDRRERFTTQYRLRRHDGEYRWLRDAGTPRFDRQGAFIGYIGSCIDVTDEKLAEEALATLGGRLMEAQEQERRHIARELHDDICQRLAVLAIELQQLSGDSLTDIQTRTEDLVNRTVGISSDVQALSHQLHCSKLEFLGIVAAIRGFCVEFARQQQNVTIDFTSGGVPTHLPRDLSLSVFRVLQEALRNVVKHSGVRHMEVELDGTSTMVLLTIRDRGRGFEPEVAMRGSGLGLISMRERAHLVKGTILVASEPGRGTEIVMRVPLEANRVSRGRTRAAAKYTDLIPSDRAS